jgi:DNA repair protein RadC
MLDEFGSFHALLDASPQEVMKRCGVSENTAVLVSLLKSVAKRYNDSAAETEPTINSKADAFGLLKSLFADEHNEGFWLICLDSAHRLLLADKISEGTKSNAVVYVDRIMDTVSQVNATYVIIAHNHPSGIVQPSRDDINSTTRIREALDTVNALLLDHIVFCNNNCYSFAQHGLCNLKY